MEILNSLGVNQTLWWHLACFLISYLALSQLIFKPYMRAFEEREKRTVGNEEHAVRLIQEAQSLAGEYETKAKSINAQIKAAFDSSRAEATKEYERLVQAAREQSQKLIEESRLHLGREIQSARKALSTEIPAVSLAIASKLAGKDLSA